MRSTKIVTSFVKSDDRLLLLRRSHKVRSMKGLWGGVSGVIEEDEEPVTRAIKEILEETGLGSEEIRLLREAEPMPVSSPQYPDHQWVIYPFLFESKTRRILLNWENTSYQWIAAREIQNYDTVPSLADVLFKLL